jgi:hypothetical protein
MHPVHTLPPYFLMIHSNVILLFAPTSSEWSFLFIFSNQNYCVHFSSLPCVLHVPPILSYHPNSMYWSIQVMKLLLVHSPPASRHFLQLGSRYSLQLCREPYSKY